MLLPADTPVISGRELPLKVHCGPVLAACEAPLDSAVAFAVAAAPLDAAVVTSAAAPQASVSIDVIRKTLMKRMFIVRPPRFLGPRTPRAQGEQQVMREGIPVSRRKQTRAMGRGRFRDAWH